MTVDFKGPEKSRMRSINSTRKNKMLTENCLSISQIFHKGEIKSSLAEWHYMEF